jgi:large subunit ribosomal protein L16
MKGKSCRGNHICFGRYALPVLEPAWISTRQIEAGWRAMTRYTRCGGKNMGAYVSRQTSYNRTRRNTYRLRKGIPKYWVAVIKPGRILYELGRVSKNASKMPIRSQFLRLEIESPKKSIEDKKTSGFFWKDNISFILLHWNNKCKSK